MDAISIMVVAICITALIGWTIQRYELRQIAKMFEEGSERTQRLIDEGRREFRELIAKMDERMAESFRRMDERFAKADKRFEVLLKSLDFHIKTSTQQHKEILGKL